MRKLKLGKKGLSPLVAVIVLLTLVMVLGAIIAGTLSGAPRPVLPATTAVNIATEYGANPAAGDTKLVIRHEYGSVISDAMVVDPEPEWDPISFLVQNAESTHFKDMVVKLNGETIPFALVYLTSNGEVKINCITPDLDLNMEGADEWVWPAAEEVVDFAAGDWAVIYLINPDLLELYEQYTAGKELRSLLESYVMIPGMWPDPIDTPEEAIDYMLEDPDAVANLTGWEGLAEALPAVFPHSINVDVDTFTSALDDYLPYAAAALDLAMTTALDPGKPLRSSDLIQVFWEPRDMMLVQYLVQ